MKAFAMSLLLLTGLAYAGLEQAPPNFDVDGNKAVFVDFQKAQYEINYSNLPGKSTSISVIEFDMPEAGYPIFDSVHTPSKVYLNGEEVGQQLISSPDKKAEFRIVKQVVAPGKHILQIHAPLKNGVWASLLGVSSGFFIRDLKARKFLERYVPSNLEYDQYQMTFNVSVKTTHRSHRIFANGEIETLGKNSFRVTYPEYYTASSVFFHIAPVGKFKVTNFKYTSIDGRKIPVKIYSLFWTQNALFKRKTLKVLKELERDYGPWPHPQLLVYGTKLSGGMEYVGATETSYVSLGHELQHSYFAKGIMPADGNSGWMDEGIASWRDKGHQSHKKPNYLAFNLGNHSVYQRQTDDNSYVKGRSFFAYLDYKLKAQGLGLKGFLRNYVEKRMYTTVTTNDFISDLREYSNTDFQEDFDRYVFGKYTDELKGDRGPAVVPENPHHPQVTEEQLDSIM